MHYHYFTLEQRSTLARLLSSLPEAEKHPALERLHAPDYGVCESCGGCLSASGSDESSLARVLRCSRVK